MASAEPKTTTSNEDAAYGRPLLNWRITEYPSYQRDRRWHIIFGSIVLGLLILVLLPSSVWPDFLIKTPVLRNFFLTGPDYTFAILILLISFVIMANGRQQPSEIDVIITTEGLIVGSKFYNYDQFKEFCIIFKPAENVRVLYLEYKNTLMPRLSLGIADADPISLRDTLLQYLEEDLERTDESNSDYFGRLFKI
jgi:hypothetical protein